MLWLDHHLLLKPHSNSKTGQKLKEELRRFEECFTEEVKQEFREKKKRVIKKGDFYTRTEIHAKSHNRYS